MPKSKAHRKPLGYKKKQTRKRKQLPLPGPNQCHPNAKHSDVGCLPEHIYEKSYTLLTNQKNYTHKNKKIGGGNNNKKEIIKKLQKILNVKPNNERSLLHKLPISQEEKQRLAQKWLRPEMPADWKKDPDMWLDSNNIRDVMKQYEEYDSSFKFLGPYPIDFASADPNSKNKEECLIDEICELDLDKEELKGKTKIGIIYNLDPHYKNGSHWVASFINVKTNECYYFDSYGMKPPKQIYKFMQWLTLQEPTMKLGWNGRRFQHSDSECGMYSMYFLDRMIAGEDFLTFCRRAPPDSFMLDLRDWMFST